jgi:hypothetical protein
MGDDIPAVLYHHCRFALRQKIAGRGEPIHFPLGSGFSKRYNSLLAILQEAAILIKYKNNKTIN